MVFDYLTETSEYSSALEAGIKLQCKFILLSQNGNHHCALGSLREFSYHANLADKYCTINGVAGSWFKKPDQFEIFDKNVQLTGGGWLEFHFDLDEIVLFGHSTAYGPYDEEIALSLLETHPPFESFTLLSE